MYNFYIISQCVCLDVCVLSLSAKAVPCCSNKWSPEHNSPQQSRVTSQHLHYFEGHLWRCFLSATPWDPE